MDCSCERLPHRLRRPAHITHETIAQNVQRVTTFASRYAPFLRAKEPDAEIRRMVEEDEQVVLQLHREAMQRLVESEYQRILRLGQPYHMQRRQHHDHTTQ